MIKRITTLLLVGLIGFSGSLEARKTGAEKAAKLAAKSARKAQEAPSTPLVPAGAGEEYAPLDEEVIVVTVGGSDDTVVEPKVGRLAACMNYLKATRAGQACLRAINACRRCEAKHPQAAFNAKRFGALAVAGGVYWSIKFMEPGSGAAVAARIAAGTMLGEVAKFTFADINRVKRFITALAMIAGGMVIDFAIMPQTGISLAIAPVAIAIGMPLGKPGYRPLLKGLRKKLDQERAAQEGHAEPDEYDAEAAIREAQAKIDVLTEKMEALAARFDGRLANGSASSASFEEEAGHFKYA